MGLIEKFSFNKKKYIGTKLDSKTNIGIFGHIDFCNREGISGWVIDMSRPMSNLTVNAYLDGRLIGSTSTNQARIDIANLTGLTAHCGFLLRWDHCNLAESIEELPDNGSCSLEVKLEGDPRPISSNSEVLKVEDIRYWVTGLDALSKENSPNADDGRMAMQPKAVADYIHNMPGQHVEPIARDEDVKLIAYYLPQFHPIPENDEWWGAGFTEWTNVTQAMPYFKDHYQPHVPSELGYYDLRLPEVREAQAKLASEYGIYGFCYYYYWFAGRRLLERPLQEVLESGKPDFPFCICWANENWSRRWDGSENEILVQQIHNEKTDEEFIRDVIPLFKDDRYIKLNGAPLLVIYRLSLLPNPRKTAATWRRICAEEGIPNIHLCMAETFGLSEPRQFGFDSAVQFPPHNTSAGLENKNIQDLAEGYNGNIYDFTAVISDQLSKESPSYNRFPGVMTSWDNTARKKKAGNIFLNSTPENYEVWLRGAIDYAREKLPEGERLVFINAWNEWAEGAHLEPDRKNGRSYLEATRRALSGQTNWKQLIEYAKALPELKGETKLTFISEVASRLAKQEMVNRHLLHVIGDSGIPKYWVPVKAGQPYWVKDIEIRTGGVCHLDQLNHYHGLGKDPVAIDSFQKMYLYGWSFSSGIKLHRNTPSYLLFENVSEPDTKFYCLISGRIERSDIPQNFPKIGREHTFYAGIKLLVDITTVTSGKYRLSVISRGDGFALLTRFETEVEIV